jgi:ABC-type dipeptide/oligopeptide/nickel transport system permease subunit
MLKNAPGASTLAVALVLLAIAGPFVAPYSPSEIVGIPFEHPSASSLLGTDVLGRDVLSRVLNGGRSVLGIAAVGTALAYAVGLGIGLTAGLQRNALDAVLMRLLDIVMAFPPLILALLFIAGLGTSIAVLILALTIVLAPGIARLARAATLEVSVRAYVEASIARGDRTSAVLFHEILPNIRHVLLADVGIRFTGAILLAAALNFLGLGLQPPQADWALMVSENRDGLSVNPWAVAAPAALIALVAVAGNLLADVFSGRLGTRFETLRPYA